MKDPTRPSLVGRRLFLRQAAAVAAVAAGICCAAGPLRELTALDADRLLAALGLNRQQATRVLDSKVARQEIERIAATWPQRSRELAGATTNRELRATIRRAIQQDYANGNLVDVDGWFLAATEALILALTAIARA
jgi:hypothetical protein